MLASRTSRAALRLSRTVRTNVVRRNVRFASNDAQSAGGVGPGVTGGLVGGGAVFAAGYLWYHFSGVKTAVNTAHQAKSYFDSATDKLKIKFDQNTPEPNEALESLKRTATTYASFIPGGKGYVDSAFKDLDAVRNKHGSEVDNIVKEAYGELRDASSKGLSLETANDAWQILQKHLQRLSDLAGDAAQDILGNHPELKDKFGGSIDQLKQMGDNLGPEAKKQVDQTWQQIQEITKGGIGIGTVEQVRKLVQEKMQAVRKLGDEAWSKGLEQAKPYLDKSPKVKQIVEENAQSLKQGNVGELWSKVKEAVDSGNIDTIEQYIKSTTEKAKQSGGGNLTSWLNMLPNGGEIMPKLTQLKDIADKHGKEAEGLLKETMDEIKTVLDKKSSKAEELAKKASENAK